jgi:DNA-binding PadR family transcriptional regulator
MRMTPDDLTVAIFRGPRKEPTGDRYDMEQLFSEWCWGTGIGSWKDGVRLLARALRGLEEAGLIERRTIRRGPGRTHHGFTLTPLGEEALKALRGDWLAQDSRSHAREA